MRWLGGIREKDNETWVWTDCSDKPFTGWPIGQPDNPKEKESCLMYSWDLKWNDEDEPCSTEKKFVCSTPVCQGKALTFSTESH